MPLDVYIQGGARGRKRPGPLAVSVALHGAAFFALLHAPEIKLPEQNKSAYKLAIEGREEKLVWYKFNQDLPDVSPPKPKRERRPVRAAVRAKQQIVASRKDAPRRTQVVWTQAPDLHLDTRFELPNVLAVRMPTVTKRFVAPPAPRTSAPSVRALPNAPEIQAQSLDAVNLAELPKVTRPFVAPPRRAPVKIAEVSPVSRIPEAPQLSARADAPALDYDFKAPHRPFTAPPKSAAPVARQAAVEAPPSLAASAALTTSGDLLNANSRDLNLAVVGLNPANKAEALPTSSSPGQFAAGPKIRPDGADSAGNTKGLSVPDLYVGGAKNANPDLLAQTFAAPTSAFNMRAAARLAGAHPARVEEEPPGSGAVKVSGAPDPRFDGRDVYMMAIQMPNLTSYSGSWLMWYSDRTARTVGLAAIAPPIAHRKVDPKYIASAVSDRIQGKIQLACVIGRDGRVSNIELVRGLDERLDKSAEEALSKWEFNPATRQGEPVEVDVLVEIPFELAPVIRKSY